jgi:hypothetical protein
VIGRLEDRIADAHRAVAAGHLGAVEQLANALTERVQATERREPTWAERIGYPDAELDGTRRTVGRSRG